MKGRAGLSWLEANGFRPVGYWTPDNAKMHRDESVKRTSGIYAFVVNGTVRYIGKAKYLRSRLRAYNLSLKDDTRRGFRRVHLGIRDTWRSGNRIDVWVFHWPGDPSEPLEQLEYRWIKEASPDWNAT